VFIFSPQGINFVGCSAGCGQLPVSHKLVCVQRYPSLYQFVLFAGKRAFQKFPIWDMEDCLSFCILHVDVWQMVLFGIERIHSYNDAVEHADGGHSLRSAYLMLSV
jgi:hypothetical protein